MSPHSPARERSYYLDIFAVSMAAIVLEISYTRIFSFKLYYYFTYLVIGLALLGLGTGGVLVAIFPRLRALAPSRLIFACAALGSVTVASGYFVIAQTQLNAFYLTVDWREPFKLLLISLVLFAPFLAVGIVIATIFGARPREVDRLYCADLIGAGLGCASAVPLISWVTPPGCVMLAGALLAAAAIHRAETRQTAWLGVMLCAACALAVVFRSALPDPVTDSVKTLANVRRDGHPVLFSRWSSVFRVDVTPSLQGSDVSHIINHDGNWGSVLHKFDGDPSTLGALRARSAPVPVPGRAREPGGSDHWRRGRTRDPRLFVLRRSPRYRRRAEPGHGVAADRALRRLQRPPRRERPGHARQRRGPFVPEAQRRSLRSRLVRRAGQLCRHERGHLRRVRALRELPLHGRDDRRDSRSPE